MFSLPVPCLLLLFANFGKIHANVSPLCALAGPVSIETINCVFDLSLAKDPLKFENISQTLSGKFKIEIEPIIQQHSSM